MEFSVNNWKTWTLKPEQICFQKYLYYVLSVPLGQWPLTCQSPQLKSDMTTSENSVLTRRWLQHSAPSSPIRVPPAVPEATTATAAMLWEASVYPSELRTGHPLARTKATMATSWLTPWNILGPHPLSSSLDPCHPEFTGIQSFLSLLNRSYMWLKKFHTRGFSSQALDMGCFQPRIPNNHCKSSKLYRASSREWFLPAPPPPPTCTPTTVSFLSAQIEPWCFIVRIIYVVKRQTTIFNKYWYYSVCLHFSYTNKIYSQ